MSRKTTASAQTKELTKAIATLSRNLASAETAIDNLKSYKDEIEDWNQTLVNLESEYTTKREEFERNLQEHKMKTVRETLETQDKIVLDKDDYNELVNEVNRNKQHHKSAVSDVSKSIEEKYKRQLENELKLRDLSHEAAISKLEAQIESHKAEIETWKTSLEGTRKELDSQKELTAQIAKANRPSESK
jgi:chromosome segregation ATPase